MLGILIFLAIILVLILINKNTKSSPESAGCVEQGCAFLVIMFVIAFVVPIALGDSRLVTSMSGPQTEAQG